MDEVGWVESEGWRDKIGTNQVVVIIFPQISPMGFLLYEDGKQLKLTAELIKEGLLDALG